MAAPRPASWSTTALSRLTSAPSLRAARGPRLPWLLAVVAVCAVGVWLAHAGHSQIALPMLLTVAPVLPLLCVATSYGGRADPFAEVTRTTPAGGLRIVLIRNGQILLICLPLLTAMAQLLPDNRWAPGAATWLLPALTLTLFTLLASSYIGCWPAALVTTTGWMVIVGAFTEVVDKKPGNRHKGLGDLLPEVLRELIGGSAQMWWAIGAAVLIHLLAKRRHAFDRAGGRR